MAYCQTSDVEAMLHETYGASTQPTKARVDDICTNVSAEIDGVLAAAGYTVPVTSAQAIALLKSYAEKGSAVQAWHESRTTDVSYPKIDDWLTSYRDFLARVRRGEQWLPGLTPTSDLEAAFAIVPSPERDQYWLTGKKLDEADA